MKRKVDLEVVYKKVKQRAIPRRCGDNPQRLAAATAAATAARTIARCAHPTPADVNRFRLAEQRWFGHAKGHSICYADVFDKMVRTGDVKSEPRYHGYGTGRADVVGTVYCLVSSALPGQVKIGSCKRELLRKRVKVFEHQHPGHRATIEYKKDVQRARKVELLAQTALRERGLRVRGPGETGKYSSEWFRVSVSGAKRVVLAAARTDGGDKVKSLSRGTSSEPSRLSSTHAATQPLLRQNRPMLAESERSKGKPGRQSSPVVWPFKRGFRP